MGIWVAIRQWFGTYLMVVLSLQNFGHYHVDMGMNELLKTLLFVSLFFLSYVIFLGEVLILPIKTNTFAVPGIVIDQ